jgi:Phage late-transcription coactivator
MLDNLLTKTTLAAIVEKLVQTEKMSYTEAVLHVCDERQLDPADMGKLIAPTIKSKIEAEAMKANLLPKSNSLDSFIK